MEIHKFQLSQRKVIPTLRPQSTQKLYEVTHQKEQVAREHCLLYQRLRFCSSADSSIFFLVFADSAVDPDLGIQVFTLIFDLGIQI